MKRVIWLLLALVAVVLAVAGAAYWFLGGDGIRLALERQASGWLGQPVRIASATGQVFPRLGIQLREVRIGEPVKIQLADVEVSTSLRSLMSRRIEDAGGTVELRNVFAPEQVTTFAADALVLALGRVPVEVAPPEGIPVERAGDCLSPRSLEEAVLEGTLAARRVLV